MLERVWRKGNPLTLLVGMQTSIATMENSVAAKSLQSCPTLCDRWTVAHQALPSMGFSRQEHWSGLPFPPPVGLPCPGSGPVSLMSPALAGVFFTIEPLGKPLMKNM